LAQSPVNVSPRAGVIFIPKLIFPSLCLYSDFGLPIHVFLPYNATCRKQCGNAATELRSERIGEGIVDGEFVSLASTAAATVVTLLATDAWT
jgi:hypothetical protein